MDLDDPLKSSLREFWWLFLPSSYPLTPGSPCHLSLSLLTGLPAPSTASPQIRLRITSRWIFQKWKPRKNLSVTHPASCLLRMKSTLHRMAWTAFIILSSSYLFSVLCCNQLIHRHHFLQPFLPWSWDACNVLICSLTPLCLCACCVHPSRLSLLHPLSTSLISPTPQWLSHPEGEVNHSPLCPQSTDGSTMSQSTVVHLTTFGYHCIPCVQYNDWPEQGGSLLQAVFSVKKILASSRPARPLCLFFLNLIGRDAPHISYFLPVYFCFFS